MSLARAPLPATTAIAIASSPDHLPCYVTVDQAHAIANAAARLGGIRDRLLVECLWQSGGRVSEVLRLRPADVDDADGALVLPNRKQRRARVPHKRVYVSPDLVADLRGYARDARIGMLAPFFRSRQSAAAISDAQAWRIVNRASSAAGVQIVDKDHLRPANPRDFRHGAAVNQVRQGVPLSEVAQQLGHARIDSTTIYTRLSNPERKFIASRVAW